MLVVGGVSVYAVLHRRFRSSIAPRVRERADQFRLLVRPEQRWRAAQDAGSTDSPRVLAAERGEHVMEARLMPHAQYGAVAIPGQSPHLMFR
jgi:hypothetical protein